MKVFISWSGDRAKALALALREWIPHVAQVAEPFVSKEDIEVGEPWFDAIEAAMADAPAGIIVVTPENQTAQWLNYEAGGMARYMGKRACPLLLDMTDVDLTGPLKNLHVAEATEEGVKKLVHDLFDRHVRPDLVDAAFARVWEELATAIAEAVLVEHVAVDTTRDPDEKLDEVVEMLREMRRQGPTAEESAARLWRTRTRPTDDSRSGGLGGRVERLGDIGIAHAQSRRAVDRAIAFLAVHGIEVVDVEMDFQEEEVRLDVDSVVGDVSGRIAEIMPELSALLYEDGSGWTSFSIFQRGAMVKGSAI